MPKFARRLFITAIVVVQLCLLPLNGGAQGATESISYVGATVLTSTLQVEDGPVPAGSFLASATFPDGSNAASYGTLLDTYCNNAGWSGSTDHSSTCIGGGTTGAGTKSCPGACQPGPTDDDYCYATTLGSWNCGVPGTAPEPGYSASGADETYASQWSGSTGCTDTSDLGDGIAQSGAAVSIDNNDPYVLAPFNPCSVASGLIPADSTPALRLGVGSAVNPIPGSSYGFALYLTNPSSLSTSGCFGVSADGVVTDSEAAQLPPRSGALLEWSVTNAPTSSTVAVTETVSCSTAADVELSGFFILSSGAPTGVGYTGVRESVAHGFTTIRWRSTRRVAGFYVYANGRQLTRRVVTSRTSKYTLRVRGVIRHPAIVAVPLADR